MLYPTTHPYALDPVKEAAWGARPRTVSQAVLDDQPPHWMMLL